MGLCLFSPSTAPLLKPYLWKQATIKNMLKFKQTLRSFFIDVFEDQSLQQNGVIQSLLSLTGLEYQSISEPRQLKLMDAKNRLSWQVPNYVTTDN